MKSSVFVLVKCRKDGQKYPEKFLGSIHTELLAIALELVLQKNK